MSAVELVERPERDAAAVRPPATGAARSGDPVGAVLVALLVAVLLTQRLGLPVGSTPIPLALLLGLVAIAVLLPRGHLRVDRVRLELFALGAGACLLATVLVFAVGDGASVTSIGLLIAVWAPFVLRVRPGRLPSMLRVARAFVRFMVAAALVGVAQLAAQFTGLWEYTDYLGESLPGLTLQSFNTNAPLYFESEIYKANALVFLEPSFLSQFCALAVAVALVLRAPTWQIVALVAGVASSVSGTGIVLLVVIVVVVLLRARHLLTVGLVLATLTAAVLVALSPVAPLLESRTDEITQEGTSGSLRFVQPWTEVVDGLKLDDQRYVIGSGAGSTQRELTFNPDAPVVYTVVPKLLYEYGVLGGGLFAVFIVIALLDRIPWKVVPVTVLVMLFLLSGSLLQPQTVLVGWLLTGVWAEQGVGRRGLLGSRRRASSHRGGRAAALRRPVAR